MAIEVITKFITLSTVRSLVYVYNDSDALVDPTAVYITLTDPAGTKKVDASNIVVTGKTATGTFEHYYNTPSDAVVGQWLGEAMVVDGSGGTAKTTIANYSFTLI